MTGGQLTASISRRDSEQALADTPYLISDGPDSCPRFRRVVKRASETHDRALATAGRIKRETQGVLISFESAIRSDLVVESNRMEGIRSTAQEVRTLARLKRELQDFDVNNFMEAVRDDRRLLDGFGLYRAYEVADEWAKAKQRPREFELRALHGLFMPQAEGGGRYKTVPNMIGKSAHVPLPPWDTAQAMDELAGWLQAGTGEPVLDAAVVHAWLTHIHPFADGNGRMARLLANLALIQAHFPPLLLRSGTDRGQYLDALAASDDGDILPLYHFFVDALRRVVKLMEKPNYVESKIRGELLTTVVQRRRLWKGVAEGLYLSLRNKAREAGWTAQLQGYPDLDDFELLEAGESEGSSWFVKLHDPRGVAQWLLWFGYGTDELRELTGRAGRRLPSVFFARRSKDPSVSRPFEPVFRSWGGRPAELNLFPGRMKPVTVRNDQGAVDRRIEEAAALVVGSVCI